MSGWKPNWSLPAVPCAHPETCGPQQPICLPCIKGRELYLKDHPNGDWAALEEWQRESWRREAEEEKCGAWITSFGHDFVCMRPAGHEGDCLPSRKEVEVLVFHLLRQSEELAETLSRDDLPR